LLPTGTWHYQANYLPIALATHARRPVYLQTSLWETRSHCLRK